MIGALLLTQELVTMLCDANKGRTYRVDFVSTADDWEPDGRDLPPGYAVRASLIEGIELEEARIAAEAINHVLWRLGSRGRWTAVA